MSDLFAYQAPIHAFATLIQMGASGGAFASFLRRRFKMEIVRAQLSGLGFALCGIRNQHEAKSGEPLFAHCLYLRG